MSAMLAAARQYLAMGFKPVICQPREKIAAVPWKPYQTVSPTVADLEAWWGYRPLGNVALVMGGSVFAVDLDGDGAERLLAEAGITLPENAPRVRTGNGTHVYLSAPQAVSNRTAVLSTRGGKPQVDIRGEGGYVLAPPSVHPSGARYVWEVPLVMPLPPAPEALLRALRDAPKPTAVVAGTTTQTWFADVWGGVDEGQRDDTAARLAGVFLRRGLPTSHVAVMLADWAARCRPPLPAEDVRRIVASIAQREAASGRVSPPVEMGPEPAPDVPQEMTISDAVDAIIAEATRADPQRIVTPFERLTYLLGGGFRPGQLTYLAARPSRGKSALSIEFARVAAEHHKRVLLVSLESPAETVAVRAIAQAGQHYASDIARWRVNADIEATAAAVRRLPVWITAVNTIPDILDTMQRLGRIDLLIVDYVQLIRGPREIRDRRLEVEWVSRQLKATAMGMDLHVLALSSVTRPTAEGREKAPTLASLRDSGALEHDGDVVLILHRADGATDTTCQVVKNRDGMTGVVKLVFRPECVSFRQLDETTPAEPDPVPPREWWT